jgi:hypothetical protein
MSGGLVGRARLGRQGAGGRIGGRYGGALWVCGGGVTDDGVAVVDLPLEGLEVEQCEGLRRRAQQVLHL